VPKALAPARCLEAGTHWFKTYHDYHIQKLSMQTSKYDLFLLISTTKEAFGIVGMQTDDTFMLLDRDFARIEEKEILKAGLKSKPREVLIEESPLNFNGGILSKDGTTLRLRQKGQSGKLSMVDISSTTFKQEYREQRARGVYLATLCQPEASFDHSIAAQHQDPNTDEAKALNRRLAWQIEHLNRGLNFVPINLSTVKLYIFIDGSFANNKDLSSQIGYEIIITNKTIGNNEETFTITGNLMDWRSIKSRRVTRLVLASEIYTMTLGFDIAYAINSTLNLITKQLDLSSIPIIVCTNSYSLCEYLIKLGTTQEKRLMIDIIAIRQSYEKREIAEIRWINRNDNPADTMTKTTLNTALITFLDSNNLNIRVEE